MAHPAGVSELSNHLTAMRTFELKADEQRRKHMMAAEHTAGESTQLLSRSML